jgi:hypothetical protein
MPFIDGESLQDRISREGELPDAIRIMREVADALASAHGIHSKKMEELVAAVFSDFFECGDIEICVASPYFDYCGVRSTVEHWS